MLRQEIDIIFDKIASSAIGGLGAVSLHIISLHNLAIEKFQEEMTLNIKNSTYSHWPDAFSIIFRDFLILASSKEIGSENSINNNKCLTIKKIVNNELQKQSKEFYFDYKIAHGDINLSKMWSGSGIKDAILAAALLLPGISQRTITLDSLLNLCKDEKEEFSRGAALINHLETGKFKYLFQPVFNASNQKVAYYECLARLLEGNGTICSIGPYISAAEKLDLISIIDKKSILLAKKLLSQYSDLSLSINISRQNLIEAKEVIVSEFSEKNIASRAIFEITETSKTTFAKLQEFIVAVKKTGAKIALDDFGSGFATLADINNLPLDIVKLDGSLIKSLTTNNKSRSLIESLVLSCNSNNIETVAEYVETEEQMKILTNLKVKYLQGFYFSEPLPGEPWKFDNK